MTAFKWTDQKLIKNLLAHEGAKGGTGMTLGQIEHELNKPGIHRRLSEMERMGLVKRNGRAVCPITARPSALWMDDDSPPRPKKTKLNVPLVHENRRLLDRIKWLEDRCAKMQKQLELYADKQQTS